MLGYIALVWNPADSIQCAEARHLDRRLRQDNSLRQPAIDCNGLILFCSAPCDPLNPAGSPPNTLLSQGSCAILGTLFRRTEDASPAKRLSALDADETEAIVQSKGHRLITSYWGSYVAFIHDEQSGATYVLRDPTGVIPCYVSIVNDVHVYFLRYEDFRKLSFTAPSINHDYLSGRLAYWTVCRRDTGLDNVSAIMAGECAQHVAGRTTRVFYWNPLHHSDSERVEDLQSAAKLIKRTTLSAVHAWAASHETILHNLSGGLDSSIVLACLQTAPNKPRIVCINKYGSDRISDERRLARSVAAHFKVRLLEQAVPSKWTLDRFDQLTPAPCPYLWIGTSEQAPLDRDNALREGASVIFDGHGGDELFFEGATLPTVIDYLHHHLPSWKAFGIVRADARLSRQSMTSVLKAALQYGIARRPWSIRELFLEIDQPLVNDSVRESALSSPEFLHPLFRDTAGLPPAKVDHAFHIAMHTAQVYNPSRPLDMPDAVSPLLSQPLIEACLRIPAYTLIQGGKDRAVARAAFLDQLPMQIINRSSKGTADSTIKTALEDHRKAIREFLLGGFLAQEHYLNIPALEDALSGRPTPIQFHFNQILDYLTLESWARSVVRSN